MDKTSKKIIKFMVAQGCGSEFVCLFSDGIEREKTIRLSDMADRLKMREKDLRAAYNYLTESGYVSHQMMSGQPVGVYLSHKGLNWKYFRRREILDYIAEKWPDFIAVAISLISLITSIVSCLH